MGIRGKAKGKRRGREGIYFNTYLTENDTLSNRHHAIHVREGLELILFITTHYIVLLDIVQALLFPTQPNDDRVWYYHLGKFHHLVVVGCGEENHLAIFRQGPRTEEMHYFLSSVFALKLKRGKNDNMPWVISHWNLSEKRSKTTTYLNGTPSKEARGGWVGGSKQKGKEQQSYSKQTKRANLCGNETNAYAQGDHLLANRKSPSHYDY